MRMADATQMSHKEWQGICECCRTPPPLPMYRLSQTMTDKYM